MVTTVMDNLPSPPIHMLFYGTLRDLERQYADGFHGFPLPERVADLWVTGASLYDAGRYPGLVFDGSANRVLCTLYTLHDPRLLVLFDEYEGYHAPDTRPLDRDAGTGSLYLRQDLPLAPYRPDLPATFTGETAAIYVFNGTVRHAPTDFPKVEGGDWLAYRDSRHAAGTHRAKGLAPPPAPR